MATTRKHQVRADLLIIILLGSSVSTDSDCPKCLVRKLPKNIIPRNYKITDKRYLLCMKDYKCNFVTVIVICVYLIFCSFHEFCDFTEVEVMPNDYLCTVLYVACETAIVLCPFCFYFLKGLSWMS